jgi:acetyl esterase/lipase
MTARLLALALLLAAAPARAADEPKVVPDVVYGHKDGLALTFDLVQPAKPTGAAVLWIQSGGWYSNWVDPQGWPKAGKGFLDRGYTLLIVRHGSAPRYAVPDAVADVRRCVRYVRLKSKELGVDPDRLGVTGGSAGGHLSLMLATTGDDGDPKARERCCGPVAGWRRSWPCSRRPTCAAGRPTRRRSSGRSRR